MKPSEISLFTPTEQTLLVDTEPKRLDGMNEDELVALLSRVRRARNKYSDLHRRQGAAAVRDTGKRYAATTSNERTLRKAEIFEDAVSRVARYVSRTARANANAVKAQRVAEATSGGGGSRTSPEKATKKTAKPANARASKRSQDVVSGKRVGSTSAATKRSQSKKDSRRG